MAKPRSGPGRDFYSLLDDNVLASDRTNAASSIRLSDIEPRSNQPRKVFEHEPLEALADSIAEFGVLQPIVVRESALLKGTYEILAGERRWRAAKMAGLNEIPAVILEGDELKAAIAEYIKKKDSNLVGKMVSQGTTPRRLTDLIGSLCDLTSGSGDKGTPIILVQGYFDNMTAE